MNSRSFVSMRRSYLRNHKCERHEVLPGKSKNMFTRFCYWMRLLNDAAHQCFVQAQILDPSKSKTLDLSMYDTFDWEGHSPTFRQFRRNEHKRKAEGPSRPVRHENALEGRLRLCFCGSIFSIPCIFRSVCKAICRVVRIT